MRKRCDQKVKYGHEPHGTRNQVSLCCQGPAVCPYSNSWLRVPSGSMNKIFSSPSMYVFRAGLLFSRLLLGTLLPGVTRADSQSLTNFSLTGLSQSQSRSYVTTDGQSASLSWCQAASGAQDQFLVTVRQLRVCSCGAPSLTRRWVSRLQLLLVFASAVIFTVVKFSSAYNLYLQFYMSAFYIVSCQGSGSLWTSNIYSFTFNSSILVYVCKICTRLGIADHALTPVSHVTTAA
jgi:hypothetical protein